MELYFGCTNGPGHFFNSPDDSVRTTYPMPGVPFDDVDGGKWRSDVQGEAFIHRKDGWTMLSFADYSIDTRQGSHSTFIIDEDMNFPQVMQWAQDAFPEIWERFDFPIFAATRDVP